MFRYMDRLAHVLLWQEQNKEDLKEKELAERAHRTWTNGKRFKVRRKTDPAFAMLERLRCRLYLALKWSGAKKAGKTVTMLGCTIPELRKYLQRQFQPGMSWENYGDWHIDHIRPCCSFDLLDPKQQRACFHFSNLQPLWAKDNFKKNGKWTDPDKAHATPIPTQQE